MIKIALPALILLCVASLNQGVKKRCRLPIAEGNCTDYTRVWGYDNSRNTCVSFTYGGCGGNANRFRYKIKCMTACVKHYKKRKARKRWRKARKKIFQCVRRP
ncbi:hypothetical protein EGR_09008 [Echinococcus granulosus]|uniref:BPTI/Kunitz inhibitor domain-containing protein n=1 Tax=Echinococcus granulosus TaxID=6210 RepID=W6U6W9_ECHGR|nr:hypothetical protein EGR_09008 [Echinococcus granulosus]EUB56116.1 hypothetical protein EGR_09008 [Echinococcus granulosus]